MDYGKKFIIIGNGNAVTYKEIFPLIKNNQLWLGAGKGMGGKAMEFVVSEDLYDPSKGTVNRKEDGTCYVSVMMCTWFTNVEHAKRHTKLDLFRKYSNDYQKYDNYNAIEVSRVENIPMDYDGIMGVPISFLDKYCPEQFEIVALGNSRENFTPNKDYVNPIKVLKTGETKNGNAINCVLAIETEAKPVGQVYYTSDNSKYLIAPYARILIRKRNA